MKRLPAVAAALLLVADPFGAAATPIETQVEAPGPSGALSGTMLAPADAPHAPLALIIPGSGAVDRNGDSGQAIAGSPYRRLAEALADLGVASVRIDKRGMFGSAGAGDRDHLTMANYASDAHAWAAALRRRTGAPCVWLIGHSEGGLVALVAAQAPVDVCGVVLIAAAGRPLAAILREQLTANPGNAPLLGEALPAIDKLEAGQHIDTSAMSPALLPLFRPAVQDFLIDQMGYDPARLLAAYPGPVLVLQGTSDLQVSMVDAERLAAARPGVTLVKIDGMNHVFKVAPRDMAANFATYADPSLPLAPGIADAIAAFVKAHPSAN